MIAYMAERLIQLDSPAWLQYSHMLLGSLGHVKRMQYHYHNRYGCARIPMAQGDFLLLHLP